MGGFLQAAPGSTGLSQFGSVSDASSSRHLFHLFFFETQSSKVSLQHYPSFALVVILTPTEASPLSLVPHTCHCVLFSSAGFQFDLSLQRINFPFFLCFYSIDFHSSFSAYI